jgi:hypothetical protein
MACIEPSPHDPESSEATEGEPTDVDLPSRHFDGWRRRSAVGAMATGVALGLRDIFYPTNNQPVLTAEAPGDPPDADREMQVILDPDDPTKSVAIFPAPDAEGPPAHSGDGSDPIA